ARDPPRRQGDHRQQLEGRALALLPPRPVLHDGAHGAALHRLGAATARRRRPQAAADRHRLTPRPGPRRPGAALLLPSRTTGGYASLIALAAGRRGRPDGQAPPPSRGRPRVPPPQRPP